VAILLKTIAAGMTALMLLGASTEACTVMVVTKGASEDGSMIVSHSNDAFGSDMNLAFVPAKDHPRGSMRPVYPSAAALTEMPDYNCFAQPNLVAPERSDDYNYPGRPKTKPIGYIPEVEHTYAYMDAAYGVANEHGLIFGECTDMSAHLPEAPYREGEGIFYAAELSRVALERCKTSREAIELMGSLIDEYGLWGTAETLAVADQNECWVLEMQPAPGGKGGFWIAERIPDGDFFIAANQLRIRAIKEGNPDQIFNPKLPQMIKDAGWAAYDENGNLDWVRSMESREFHHPYYSQRRVWSAMNDVAPSRNLPSRVADWDAKTYPLSIHPERKLGVEDLARLYRNYYAGTEYDKSRGPLSGLYGSPYHYEVEEGQRSILSAKTSYTHIVQLNESLPSPVVWFSTNAPYENPFIPLTVGKLPKVYDKALRDTYNPDKLYWASNEVMALNQGFFNIMSPMVSKAVEDSEKTSLGLVKSYKGHSREKFAAALEKNAINNFHKWRELTHELLKKYNGGQGVTYGSRMPDPKTPTEY